MAADAVTTRAAEDGPSRELGAAISQAGPATHSDLVWGLAPSCGPATPASTRLAAYLLSSLGRPLALRPGTVLPTSRPGLSSPWEEDQEGEQAPERLALSS